MGALQKRWFKSFQFAIANSCLRRAYASGSYKRSSVEDIFLPVLNDFELDRDGSIPSKSGSILSSNAATDPVRHHVRRPLAIGGRLGTLVPTNLREREGGGRAICRHAQESLRAPDAA